MGAGEAMAFTIMLCNCHFIQSLSGKNTLQTCFLPKAGLSLKKDYNKYYMIIKTFKAKERPDQLPIFSLLAPKEEIGKNFSNAFNI